MDANSAMAAKFSPPAVARSNRDVRPLSSPRPPIWNATISTHGSAATIANTIQVRRRRSCRSASTRSGSVPRAA